MQPELTTFIEGLAESSTFHESLSLYQKTELENRRFANLDQVRLAYLEFGDEEAMPLIWLHGSCFNRF